jgi:hypothetical protein
MKNNTTLPISTSGSIMVICRVYDSSAKETNNQSVTYTMNSIYSDDEDTDTITSKGTMIVSDYSTKDSIGLKGISDSTDGNVTIINTDTISVPTGVNTSTIVIAFLSLLSIILFIITKLIKRAKVTTI